MRFELGGKYRGRGLGEHANRTKSHKAPKAQSFLCGLVPWWQLLHKI